MPDPGQGQVEKSLPILCSLSTLQRRLMPSVFGRLFLHRFWRPFSGTDSGKPTILRLLRRDLFSSSSKLSFICVILDSNEQISLDIVALSSSRHDTLCLRGYLYWSVTLRGSTGWCSPVFSVNLEQSVWPLLWSVICNLQKVGSMAGGKAGSPSQQ